MKSWMKPFNLVVPVFLLAVAALTGVVWRYGYDQALDQLARRAESDLALASDRLATQLQTYQELAVLMADHPELERLDLPERVGAANGLLREVADKTGAMDIIYADRDGRVIASAEVDSPEDISGTPYFRRATQGALGRGHGQAGGERAYFFAAPIFAPDGAVRGALVFVADIELIEQAWRGDNPAVLFTDVSGDVFVTNRSELLGWDRPEGGIGLVAPDGTAGAFRTWTFSGHEIWEMGWGPYLPARALHLAQSMPTVGLTGEVLVDIAPARRLAGLQAAAVAAICLAFGATLFVATIRRRTLAEANAVLEARVAQRTRALSTTNTRLRREIAERQEAEAALTRAQADLVQAGKLSALGQMSAGISHELNQPLMAIRSFAENGAQYLERGRDDVAAANLGRISELARRMGRIIQNLRTFSRQESETPRRVDVVAAFDSVLEMVSARLEQEGVTLHYDRPSGPVWARGGEVRLGQVFLNLVTNAIDAMQNQSDKSLTVAIDQGPPLTVLLRDTGPGIDDPEKIFDPFYTTKAVGLSEGMGLGLSISYGLVQSFGGDIRGRNSEAGGAEFTVHLEPWQEEQAA